MSRRRWLVLASHVPPDGSLGGMIRYTVEVTRSLTERCDLDVHVQCRPGAVPFFRSDVGVAADHIHASARGSILTDSLVERHLLHRLARSLGADVIFGSKQIVTRRPGAAVRLLTVHDLLPLDRPHDFGLLKRILLPSVYRRSIRDAELLACVSDATRAALLRHEPGAEPKAVVVPNAMTASLLGVEPEPIRQCHDRRYALIVGDHSKRKNVGHIVGLWSRVVDAVPDAHLALVGPQGWGRNEALPELDDLAAAGAASVLGRVSDGALRWAYEHAQVTLCPSLHEGFGLPVIEALHFGCPVITSCDPAQVEAADGRATVVDVADVAGWTDTIVAHLTGEVVRPRRPPTRTWADVAADLVDAVAATQR